MSPGTLPGKFQSTIAIFDEIARRHAFIHFFKIDGCQVTVIYEPEKGRLDRLDQETQAEQATLAVVKKSAKKLTLEDLEFKVKHLELKNLYVTVSAWAADKPQEFQIIDSSIFGNGLIFKSHSAIAVSRKLTKISKERQAVTAADRALAVKAYESGACEKKPKMITCTLYAYHSNSNQLSDRLALVASGGSSASVIDSRSLWAQTITKIKAEKYNSLPEINIRGRDIYQGVIHHAKKPAINATGHNWYLVNCAIPDDVVEFFKTNAIKEDVPDKLKMLSGGQIRYWQELTRF